MINGVFKKYMTKRHIIIFIVFLVATFIIVSLLEREVEYKYRRLNNNYLHRLYINKGTNSYKPHYLDTITNYNLIQIQKHRGLTIHDFDKNKLNLSNGLSILDCGGGRGDFFNYINNHYNINYTIIENDKEKVDYLRKKYKKVKVIHDSFDNIDRYYKKPLFDRILFMESHGYSKNHHNLFSKCSKIIKKGGFIYIKSVGFIPSNMEMVKNMQKQYINNTQYNMEHHHFTMNRLLKNGFVNIKYSSINYPLLLMTYNPKYFLHIAGNLYRHNNLKNFLMLFYMNCNTIIAYI